MSRIFLTLATIAGGLLLSAASIYYLGDRSVLTAPPDSITEGFVRELTSERFERALPYLADSLQTSTTTQDLKFLCRRSLRDESVWDVSATTLTCSSSDAETEATVRYANGDSVKLPFSLVFVSGVWSIEDLAK
jgi:hypothetical protein